MWYVEYGIDRFMSRLPDARRSPTQQSSRVPVPQLQMKRNPDSREEAWDRVARPTVQVSGERHLNRIFGTARRKDLWFRDIGNGTDLPLVRTRHSTRGFVSPHTFLQSETPAKSEFLRGRLYF